MARGPSWTIEDTVRQTIANSAGTTGLGIPLVLQWVERRYRELADRLHLRHLRNEGEIVYPAPVTTGTVAVVNGSKLVIGTGTTWTNQNIGWYFRFNTNWYHIDDVQPTGAGQNIILHSPYTENTSNVQGYQLVQRFLPVDGNCRWVEGITHPRLFRRLLERTMNWLDAREPARILVAAFPTVWAEGPSYHGDYAGQDSRRKTVEIYPYSTQQEFFRYLWWEVLPPVQLTDTLPPEIDPYMLMEGAKADVYEYRLNQMMQNPGDGSSMAQVWLSMRDKALGIWEQKVMQAVVTDMIALDEDVELWTGSDTAELSDIDSEYDNYISRLGIITVQ